MTEKGKNCIENYKKGKERMKEMVSLIVQEN